jgi:dimethylhistidine N-methyltransferase
MSQRPSPVFIDLAPQLESFRDAVLDGLASRPKTLPCKFFYDEAGAALFERICEQPEYYPTRAELEILEDRAGEIAALLGPRCQLVELGSGAGVKVRLLLDRLERPAGYVAIDISRDQLLDASGRLARAYPELEVTALCADYTGDLAVPPPPSGWPERQAGFFPGSTIGNFRPDEAEAFLARWAGVLRRGALRPGCMLVGVDLRKAPAVLDAAYDDASGITAAFNLNLLARINRELEGGFDLGGFAHRALWNATHGRVEMHLVSRRPQLVMVAGRRFGFAAGETIHTENSYKYAIPEFQALARRAGFRPRAAWTDGAGRFSLHFLEVH